MMKVNLKNIIVGNEYLTNRIESFIWIFEKELQLLYTDVLILY